MNILTKICIVVLAVVALLACPVFVRQATVIPYYKGMYEQEQRRSALVLQDRDNINLAYEESVRQRDKALDDYSSANQERLNSDAKLRNDVAKRELELAASKALGARLQAENGALVALHKDDQRRLDDGLALNLKYREQIEVLGEGKARVEDLLAEARVQLTKAQALAKLFRDREGVAVRDLEIANELIAKYRRKHPNIDADDGKGTNGTPEVHATILAVKEGIASINAGSAKGIRSGMRLVVYRGAQFVGYLKIIEVEAQEAAGLMVDAAVEAQQGDKVTDEQSVGRAATGG